MSSHAPSGVEVIINLQEELSTVTFALLVSVLELHLQFETEPVDLLFSALSSDNPVKCR